MFSKHWIALQSCENVELADTRASAGDLREHLYTTATLFKCLPTMQGRDIALRCVGNVAATNSRQPLVGALIER